MSDFETTIGIVVGFFGTMFLLLLFNLGVSDGKRSVADDCNKFGKFYVNAVPFECKRIGE